MNLSTRCAFVVISLTVSSLLMAEECLIVATGAKLEKLADGFLFTEGATCDPQGNVFFVDQPKRHLGAAWDVVTDARVRSCADRGIRSRLADCDTWFGGWDADYRLRDDSHLGRGILTK